MLLIFPSFLFGEEQSSTLLDNSFAIGFDNIPFDSPSNIEFRYCKNEEKGRKIIINWMFSLEYNNQDPDYRYLSVNFPGITYIWLNRKENEKLERCYIYKGSGIKFDLNFTDRVYEETYQKAYVLMF